MHKGWQQVHEYSLLVTEDLALPNSPFHARHFKFLNMQSGLNTKHSTTRITQNVNVPEKDVVTGKTEMLRTLEDPT